MRRKVTDRFEDTSGNEKTLIGMNGAAVMSGGDVGNLEIRPDRSLATTWGTSQIRIVLNLRFISRYGYANALGFTGHLSETRLLEK